MLLFILISFFIFVCVLEGKIKVFIEYQKEPLAVAEDKNVIPVKYFGFASYDNSLAKFFYNCEGENAYQEDDIKKLCRYAEATENEYNEFHKITDIQGIRGDGYIINFPFYIQAERDAHVLLTTVPMANREANEYEIRKYSIISCIYVYKIPSILLIPFFFFSCLPSFTLRSNLFSTF